jgi:hypothetical protein
MYIIIVFGRREVHLIRRYTHLIVRETALNWCF